MSADKLKEDKFDESLRRALRGHTEPVPTDFSETTLKQIREAQERRILAKVIMQERLALAGCIALGIITIVAVAVFPSIAGSLTEQTQALIDKFSETIAALSGGWTLYMVLVGLFGFAVYTLVELLVSDS